MTEAAKTAQQQLESQMINKLQVTQHQASHIAVVDCPESSAEISISHCNRWLCSRYKGRVENVDTGEHFIACDDNVTLIGK